MSKTNPKVAIITRTKNRPEFLKRAIESVKRQTYKDYVHVILNDGGDKKAVEKAVSGLSGDKYQLIHNKDSVGITPALNQAIKASKSEYIAILDDDDAWHPDRLKLSVETLESKGAVASVSPMEIVVEDVGGNGEIREVSRSPHPESWTGEVSLYKQAHRNFLSNGAIFYKRSVYDELGGYDEALAVAEDWDFGIRLMLKYDVEQVTSDKALVYYHQRPEVKDEILGNSVHAGVCEQERSIMRVRNKHLREDIAKGVFGVGFIMNDSEQNLINVVRLEGHVNYQADRVQRELEESLKNYLDQKIEENRATRRLRNIAGKIKDWDSRV